MTSSGGSHSFARPVGLHMRVLLLPEVAESVHPRLGGVLGVLGHALAKHGPAKRRNVSFILPPRPFTKRYPLRRQMQIASFRRLWGPVDHGLAKRRPAKWETLASESVFLLHFD
jgi:hypothetical protein